MVNLVTESTYPELVLHQIGSVLVEFIQQRPRLLLGEVLEAPLQHTTAVWVCRKFIHVPAERVDEFQSIG